MPKETQHLFFFSLWMKSGKGAIFITVKQKQCLLCYLGYYSGAIDGIWGEQSTAATKQFQQDSGLEADGIFGSVTEETILEVIADGDWWDSIRYFTRKEFACKCGKYCDGYPAQMRREVVELADGARAHFGAPGIVVSGLRCEQHNANVGGVANSQHMYGEAVDLKIQGVSAVDLLVYIQSQPGVRYAYAINETNVHFDIPKGER